MERSPNAAVPGGAGLLLVDKPVGPSSFAIVRDAKRRYGAKAGHAGTLDPAASGLLLVLLGRATRLAQYLVGLDKRYETTVRLGARTSTGDAEGDVIEEPPLPADVEAAVAALIGEVELPVPAASAVHVDGVRAYELHRRGVAVEMPLRRSTVHEARILAFEPPHLTLALHVSSGTYVRALADALGGHCASLRRTTVGPFRVDDADPERPLPAGAAVPFLPVVELDDALAARVAHGHAVPTDLSGPVALVHGGALLAVARGEGGHARPETVLCAA